MNPDSGYQIKAQESGGSWFLIGLIHCVGLAESYCDSAASLLYNVHQQLPHLTILLAHLEHL